VPLQTDVEVKAQPQTTTVPQTPGQPMPPPPPITKGWDQHSNKRPGAPEKGDANRRPGRKPPGPAKGPGKWKGPWPPKPKDPPKPSS
jgi:hypothetical protein